MAHRGLEPANPRRPGTGPRRALPDNLEQATQPGLFGLRRRPIAILRRIPQPDIASRIDIAEARHHAMRAHRQHAIDDNFGPGHQRNIRPVGQIVQHKAEPAIIAAAILEAVDDTLTRQADHGCAVELGVDANRDIIGDHRHLRRVFHIAKMIDDLGHGGPSVEWRGDHDGVGPSLFGRSCMPDHPICGGIDNAGQHRQSPGGDFDRVFNDLAAGGFVMEHHLGCRAEHE